MDESLKKDLKGVKEKIKSGIQDVIKELEVEKLDQKVKDDLKTLRKKIQNLSSTVESSTADGAGLVSEHLKALKETYTTLYKLADKNEANSIVKLTKGLDQKFRDNIQSPLSTKVKAVDQAIERLGGKFNKGGTFNSIQEIFGHIQKQVGEIKGEAGTVQNGWKLEGGSGLEGIKSKVDHYFKAFSEGNGWKFAEIAKGWIEETILKNNGLVRDKINDKIVAGSKENAIQEMAGKMKDKLKNEVIDEAFKKLNFVTTTGNDEITQKIEKVKEACEAFADDLDGKLKEPDSAKSGIVHKVKGELTSYIAKKVKCICYCGHCNNNKECSRNSVTAFILGALSSVSRQVGNELNSVFLNNDNNGNPSNGSIAAILDKITPIAEELDEKLKAATNNSLPPPGQDSPAKAVDSRLKAVREFVSGKNGNDITKIFNEQVKHTLAEEVNKLPGAVNAFNKSAEAQIKAAAQTAINKAAEQISSGGKIELGPKLMEQFINKFNPIKTGLKEQLDTQVDEHIGQDDPTGGQADKVTLSDLFKQYITYVVPEKVKSGLTGIAGEGKLPEAIGKIKGEGLDALEKTIGDGQPDKIDNNNLHRSVQSN
ncbi:Extracellular matrix-binding ebh, putative [Babesia ovata]|uniref:Extracellular matrix-binding ebh, putative n=1 Tax=Babesia ovata TaxID=189622 RepID=A0A2H6K6I3_9APIC|nr:Extracellular matrix-binding ebh, putative [Babesia ovata]GBE58607.1 Extracellular matrix-binding ebh, putative [Babesia ovata]